MIDEDMHDYKKKMIDSKLSMINNKTERESIVSWAD